MILVQVNIEVQGFINVEFLFSPTGKGEKKGGGDPAPPFFFLYEQRMCF